MTPSTPIQSPMAPESASTADEFVKLMRDEVERREREERAYREQRPGFWQRLVQKFAVL